MGRPDAHDNTRYEANDTCKWLACHRAVNKKLLTLCHDERPSRLQHIREYSPNPNEGHVNRSSSYWDQVDLLCSPSFRAIRVCNPLQEKPKIVVTICSKHNAGISATLISFGRLGRCGNIQNSNEVDYPRRERSLCRRPGDWSCLCPLMPDKTANSKFLVVPRKPECSRIAHVRIVR